MEANQHLIRTMSVKPPMGTGRVRLVMIGAGWQGRSPALRRHPCALHRRNRPHRASPRSKARARSTAASDWCLHERLTCRLIVSTAWLAEHLGSPDIAILDASWHLPAAKRDAKAEFLAGHIPGAQFFDIDEISDTASPLPHMLPSPEKFSSRMRKMGIGDGKKVICL